MSSAITVAGQTRINQLRGEEKPLVIDRMVLALVPGLDPTQAVDRNQQMPDPAHIVHTYDIPAEFKGYVNPDQVVYSMILGSDVGDFSFNWIGTVEAVTGAVISVTTTPETPKRKTDLATNTTGNNITRNVMMQFQDAQALTGVSISAETWQFDYTTWMVAKIAEHDQDGGAHQDIRDALANHNHLSEYKSGENAYGWWEIFPDGTIHQGGNLGGFSGGVPLNADVTFPIQFPTQCDTFVATVGVAAPDYDTHSSYRESHQSISYGMPTHSGVEGQIFITDNFNNARKIHWFAKGK